MPLIPDSDPIGAAPKLVISEKVQQLSDEPSFKEAEIDKSLNSKIHPLIKVEVINAKYNLGQLLIGLGCDLSGSNVYCPFHPDEMTGKASAKYHADTDRLYCFSENKSYSAYHAIKLLYGLDIDRVFTEAWMELPIEKRHELMDKYDDEKGNMDSLPPEWVQYKEAILDKFKEGQVTFAQYKNALYKVLGIIYMAEEKRSESKV